MAALVPLCRRPANPLVRRSFSGPALATLKSSAPSGRKWLHEIKFDGYRLQAHVRGGNAIRWVSTYKQGSAHVSGFCARRRRRYRHDTLDRPDKLNAFTPEMLEALVSAVDECDRRDDVQVAILTGAGRGFCSGGDIGGMGEAADQRPHVTKERIWRMIQSFPKRIATFEKPIIAAINGPAVGGEPHAHSFGP